MFANPPIFNSVLTLSAMTIFIISSVLLKSPQNWIFDIVNVLIAGAISFVFTWNIVMYKLGAVLSANKLQEERNNYYNQSMVDELTQLNNRRDFMQTFQRYLTDHRDTDKFLCLAIIDIDFFKNYNDYYGHPKGDECLRAMGGVLSELCKGTGIYAARIGGEEFVLLWFEQEKDRAVNVISDIQQRVNDLKIPHEKSKVAKFVTVSIGVYTAPCCALDDMGIITEMYSSADSALYEAKEKGRNRAVIKSGEIK